MDLLGVACVVFNVSLRFPVFPLFVSLPLRIVLGLAVVVEWQRCDLLHKNQCPNTFACKPGGLKPMTHATTAQCRRMIARRWASQVFTP